MANAHDVFENVSENMVSSTTFNYDLDRMKEAVNAPTVVVPNSALSDFESFQRWLQEVQ